MTGIVIGAADQTLALELRSALAEIDGVEVTYLAESSTELVAAVLRLDPDIVIVHDLLGPEPALQTMRDLTLRRPTVAALLASGANDSDVMSATIDAGGRGTIAYPLTFEQLQSRITAAREWSGQMRKLLQTSAGGYDSAERSGRAKVVALAGSKGGCGVTTIALHTALDLRRCVPGVKVCLVDLDLEKGDVTGALVLRHRVTIADVAKVAEDLSSRTLADAMVIHESGLHLLLPPVDIRDTEVVTPRALRQMFAVLRNEYDLVLVDAGSHVTPVQATIVEMADEVVAVVTPDVLSMRGLRRVLNAWDALGVRSEQDVRVLVNRVSKSSTVSFDTVRRLTQAPVIPTGLPAMFLRLEAAINERNPMLVRDKVWWRSLRAIGSELGLGSTANSAEAATNPDPGAGIPGAYTTPAPSSVPQFAQPDGRRTLNGTGTDGYSPPQMTKSGERRRARASGSGRRARRGSDAGAIALETIALVPAIGFVALLCWQMVIYGLAFVWVGQASNAAAHAAAVGEDPGYAARESVPDAMESSVSVSRVDLPGNRADIVVRMQVPLLAPGVANLPATVSTEKRIVLEP